MARVAISETSVSEAYLFNLVNTEGQNVIIQKDKGTTNT